MQLFNQFSSLWAQPFPRGTQESLSSPPGQAGRWQPLTSSRCKTPFVSPKRFVPFAMETPGRHGGGKRGAEYAWNPPQKRRSRPLTAREVCVRRWPPARAAGTLHEGTAHAQSRPPPSIRVTDPLPPPAAAWGDAEAGVGGRASTHARRRVPAAALPQPLAPHGHRRAGARSRCRPLRGPAAFAAEGVPAEETVSVPRLPSAPRRRPSVAPPPLTPSPLSRPRDGSPVLRWAEAARPGWVRPGRGEVVFSF